MTSFKPERGGQPKERAITDMTSTSLALMAFLTLFLFKFLISYALSG